MKKLQLNLDDLKVESFSISNSKVHKGTVLGNTEKTFETIGKTTTTISDTVGSFPTGNDESCGPKGCGVSAVVICDVQGYSDNYFYCNSVQVCDPYNPF